MSRLGRIEGWAWPLVALVALIVCVWQAAAAYDDIVITRVVMLAFLNTIFVVGLFTYSGNSGMMSFGHISYAALGAYTTAYLTIPTALKPSVFPDMPGFLDWLLRVHADFVPAVLIGGLVAAIFAALVAPAIVRLPALQGAIATLSLLIVVHSVLNNWTDVTRGQSTLIGVPADLTLAGAAVGAIGACVLAWVVTTSNVGLRLRASREDPIAAQAVGIAIARERTVAWVISAFIVGTGGGLYAHFITTFNPDQFFLLATFTIVAMLIIGGMKSLAGAVLGTLVFSALAEVLRRAQAGDFGGGELPAGTGETLLAALLLVVIILRPNGLTGGKEIPHPRRLAGMAHRWRTASPRARAKPNAIAPSIRGRDRA